MKYLKRGMGCRNPFVSQVYSDSSRALSFQHDWMASRNPFVSQVYSDVH